MTMITFYMLGKNELTSAELIIILARNIRSYKPSFSQCKSFIDKHADENLKNIHLLRFQVGNIEGLVRDFFNCLEHIQKYLFSYILGILRPYKLIKDLRTGHETGNVQAVLDGDLNAFIKAMLMYQTNVAVE